MLSDAIRKRLQPKESSLSERDAMLPAHYESSLVTYAAQSDRRNSLEDRARLPQHASRTLLSPSASYEPQMQGTENHGRRTPKRKVSWAGRLPPDIYSRD